MKLKKLPYLLVTLLFLSSGLNINAQQRSSSKSRSTTKKTTTNTKPAAGSPLNKDMMEGAELLEIRPMDPKISKGQDLGYSVLIYSIYLLPDNIAAGMRANGDIIEWKHAIKGNTLELSQEGRVAHSFVSSDQGKTFKRTDGTVAKIYNIGRGGQKTLTQESMENALEKGGYTCYLNLFKSNEDPQLFIPVTVKLSPDEDDENKGVLKVTSDSKLMAQVGAIKVDYQFEENKFLYTNLEKEECDFIYSEWKDNYFYLKLGRNKIGSVGLVDLILTFIKK